MFPFECYSLGSPRMKPDQDRVKVLLAETITLLCKNGLSFRKELKIEGVVGITVDDNEVFIVHVNEELLQESSIENRTKSTQELTTAKPSGNCERTFDKGKTRKTAWGRQTPGIGWHREDHSNSLVAGYRSQTPTVLADQSCVEIRDDFSMMDVKMEPAIIGDYDNQIIQLDESDSLLGATTVGGKLDDRLDLSVGRHSLEIASCQQEYIDTDRFDCQDLLGSSADKLAFNHNLHMSLNVKPESLMQMKGINHGNTFDTKSALTEADNSNWYSTQIDSRQQAAARSSVVGHLKMRQPHHIPQPGAVSSSENV